MCGTFHRFSDISYRPMDVQCASHDVLYNILLKEHVATNEKFVELQ